LDTKFGTPESHPLAAEHLLQIARGYNNRPSMDTVRITELLKPFLQVDDGNREALSQPQLQQLSSYLDLLQRWNAKTNLTSVREPEEIVKRHFGESLFLARAISGEAVATAIDVGSGAGFPGIPLKIYSPLTAVTLVESQNKKATFLKEVIRECTLIDINVFSGRAETLKDKADLVTLRAVEHFDDVLPVAAGLVVPKGRLALLIGVGQVAGAERLLPSFEISTAAVPQSRERVLLIARNQV
jgi:16S rRNA (guanine527-N7)-methyltransferase